MHTANRAGVTWVEVLVVMLVLGLGLGLAVTYLLGQREAARQQTCSSRQKKVAQALLAYEKTERHFPGYVNPGNGKPVSWVISVLDNLGQADLYGRWRDGDGSAVYLPQLVCPSDPPKETAAGSAPLSYVVNCGRPRDEDMKPDGVFFNHAVDAGRIETSLAYIDRHDGAPFTLMLSENVQAGRWTDTAEADLGMVWRVDPGPCSNINQCLDAGDRPQDVRYARPSSFHAGGVNVTFCDAQQKFLSDAIDYRVYRQMMAVDAPAAGVSATDPPDGGAD